jgi:hypothetical protein
MLLFRTKNEDALTDNAPYHEPEELPQGYLGLTPPPGQLPPKGERHWVDHPEHLQRAVQALKQAQFVAVDAEFTQVRSRTQHDKLSSIPRLALLQLAVEQQCFVIDTLRLNDLSPLMAVFADYDIAILLHGAGADLRVMAERGLYVVHYYDLEATSRSIFGQHESSLAAMLQRAFSMRLDKSLQRTDWTRRPLPQAMIAYAARDAEVTLALYHWLEQYYPDILALHEYTDKTEPVAAWIEPFLSGTATIPPEAAVAEATEQGLIHGKAQLYEDCRSALKILQHPIHRSRLLRLIADLSLTKLAPDIERSLQASTSDERAAAARALGRLNVKSAHNTLTALLQDPVQDVRKAAQTALYHLGTREPRPPRVPTTRASDGTRSWIIETTEPAAENNGHDTADWKARLRSIIQE